MKLGWPESYRLVHSRYPFVGIFDRIADPADLEIVAELERRTNDRILDELGTISLVRAGDRVAGPGTTPIMASFTHAKPSRFSDGAYGIYYAARHLETAIAESRFHVEAFYRATAEPSADVDMRIYAARIAGRFDDLSSLPMSDPRLDPNSYDVSRPYGAKAYEANAYDGIVYPSVRDAEHRLAAACFRPRAISHCYSHGYVIYRWDGTQQRIVHVLRRDTLTGFL